MPEQKTEIRPPFLINQIKNGDHDSPSSDHDSPSSATEIYVHELIIYHTLKTFVLQDYLEKSSSLKV